MHNRQFYIYNFFPLLYGDIRNWKGYLKDIADMGFNIIYVNPIYQSGHSGSLYAAKDYFTLDQRFSGGRSEDDNRKDLKEFTAEAFRLGLKTVLDLVINHTSFDCPLVSEKPEWYMKKDGQPVHPGAFHGNKWVEWGDLVRINNETSPDETGLYEYWLKVCTYYIDLGFEGFRADAAYQVPVKLWKYLIKNTRAEGREILFIGETLGCEIDDTIDIAGTGFDAVMNSSKYWNYAEGWIFPQLMQQLIYLGSFPTVGFPESHDTPRLMAEEDGNIASFLARLQFIAFWSAGIMITTGFEFAYRKSVNVVKTTPLDREDTGRDFRMIIGSLLHLKKSYNVLHEDSYIEKADCDNSRVVALLKISHDRSERVLFILNKNMTGGERIYFRNICDAFKMEGKPVDISLDSPMVSVPWEFEYVLLPGQVRMIYMKGKGGIMRRRKKV